MPPIEMVLWAGLAVGLAFGACGQITGFCLNRGLKDYWSGRHGYKLHAFALALAVALIGTHVVATMGLVNIDESLYMTPSFSWLLLPLGGVMFGYGMGLANGCGARALVLLAQGNLRSFVVLVCLGIAASVPLTGVAAPWRIAAAELTTLAPALATVPDGIVRVVIVGVLAAALALFSLRPRAGGQRLRDLAGGA